MAIKTYRLYDIVHLVVVERGEPILKSGPQTDLKSFISN